MNRIIDYYLALWRDSPRRKPLILKGARQVGKTYAIRKLGEGFVNLVEINFEVMRKAKLIFQKDLTPRELVKKIEAFSDQKITPGKSLLFFDEIQAEPSAITALRYFYEQMPELHVIAAGSLLDFALDKVGMPVGRVSSYHMYPMSFIEFLWALDHSLLAKEI